ncbi:nuclear transport factor 2 family protein [Chthonobacter rhizosphaerae]|uniref:nuclear transport factor 2 family protein n=1 Tax=Chthonobacter rhizosphaerae TaxID=2735553 RepID=UPI0015EF49F9|nr:nuclear transport factor 2 family protein [Chthonobacter rhizosphaerae]
MTAKRFYAVAVSSLVLAAATPAFANTGACPAMDATKATALFDRWAKALPGHNADLVLAHYAPQHSFKSYSQDAALTDRTAIRDYWSDFVDLTPRATLKQSDARIDCETVVKSGVKEIVAGPETVMANFTMEFQNQDGVWLITRHEMNTAD